MNAPFNRGTGLLVIEVINSNPNGDPDRESDPRQRPDRCGEISPVSYKRKLRDLVADKDGPVWQSAQKSFSLNAERFHILESRGRVRQTILTEIAATLKAIEDQKKDPNIPKPFIDKYWDGRVFGNTFIEEARIETDQASGRSKKKAAPAFIKTGTVQFGLGISIVPIRIGRHTNTNMSGVEEGKDRGMAPFGYRFVEHGVYAMPFFVNPSQAHKTGCTVNDIEVLKAVIPYAYSNTPSHARSFINLRHAWYAEHNSPLGSCSDYDLIRALTPVRKGEQIASTSIKDYDVPEAKDLPESLQKRIKSLTDLMPF